MCRGIPVRGSAKDYNPLMPTRSPELQMSHDENSIPVTAKCSLCGEQMQQHTPRITNPIENVEWFSSQFARHVMQNHPVPVLQKSAFGRILLD